jgi:hypothetical protein
MHYRVAHAMTLKEFAYAHRLSYRTAKRMLRDGRLRRIPGPFLRGFHVELVPVCPLGELAGNHVEGIIIGK